MLHGQIKERVDGVQRMELEKKSRPQARYVSKCLVCAFSFSIYLCRCRLSLYVSVSSCVIVSVSVSDGGEADMLDGMAYEAGDGGGEEERPEGEPEIGCR